MIDPRKIPLNDTPLIVFSSHSSGFISWIIKFRTKGSYNHCMWQAWPWKFASQGNTYSEVALSRYMKKGNRLKFVEIIGLTREQKELIRESISNKLAKPWWQKRYDFLAIFGQAIGIPKINNPWLDICSEDMPQHVKYMACSLDPDNPLKRVIDNIPRYASPAILNEYFKRFPNFFKVYGRWDHDAIDDNKFFFNLLSRMFCFS